MTIKIAQQYTAGGNSYLEGERMTPEEFLKGTSMSDVSDLRVEIELSPETEMEEELMEHSPKVEGEIHVSSDDEDFEFDEKKEFSFILGKVPGSDSEEEIEEPSELQVSEDDDKIQIEDDPWKWKHEKFLHWLEDKLKNVPKHNGKDVSGLEKAMAYLEHLDKECSKASRTDLNNVIDTPKLEDARKQIIDGIDRLFDRLQKVNAIRGKKGKGMKKKASEDNSEGFVKEAKSIHFEVNVPYFISLLARICINASVSAGHDIEEVFMDLAKKYELTKQQKLEVVTLIEDMGYASVWRDRSKMLDEEIDLTSSENGDWAAQYPA
jgi:hypothetical protein